MALIIRLSGGPSNTDPDASLGGIMSSTALIDAVLNNLFDKVLRKDILVVDTEFRCFYLLNTGSNPVHGARLRIDEFPAKTIISIGVDPIGQGDGSTFGVATTISTEDSVPTGVIFYGEVDGAISLPVPTLLANQAIAFWVKRVTETGKAQTLTVGVTSDDGEEEVLTTDDGKDSIQFGEIVDVEKNPSAKIGTAVIGFFEAQ